MLSSWKTKYLKMYSVVFTHHLLYFSAIPTHFSDSSQCFSFARSPSRCDGECPQCLHVWSLGPQWNRKCQRAPCGIFPPRPPPRCPAFRYTIPAKTVISSCMSNTVLSLIYAYEAEENLAHSRFKDRHTLEYRVVEHSSKITNGYSCDFW